MIFTAVAILTAEAVGLDPYFQAAVRHQVYQVRGFLNRRNNGQSPS